jgi:hypothetical protein
MSHLWQAATGQSADGWIPSSGPYASGFRDIDVASAAPAHTQLESGCDLFSFPEETMVPLSEQDAIWAGIEESPDLSEIASAIYKKKIGSGSPSRSSDIKLVRPSRPKIKTHLPPWSAN